MKIKITQAMLDNMRAAIPASTRDDADFSTFDNALNQSIDVPDFIYNKSANANFDFMVAMTMPDGSGSNTFFWKGDYSRTAMKIDTVQSGMTITGTMVYDATTNSSLMYFSFNGSDFTMKIVADPADKAAHGVFLNQTSGSYSMNAFADDTGGEVINNYGGTKYTEDFSATGALTYQDTNGTPQGPGTINAAYAAKLSPLPTNFGAAGTFF